jgi:hypothetical protein
VKAGAIIVAAPLEVAVVGWLVSLVVLDEKGMIERVIPVTDCCWN